MTPRDLEDKVRKAVADLEDEETSLRGLSKGVLIRPEFDCHDKCAFGSPDCRPGAGGYHGCGARRVLFFVRVEGRGGVAFDLYTPIYLPETEARSRVRGKDLHFQWHPLGSVDLHLAVPPANEEWMVRVDGECFVSGNPEGCWCDGTTLQTEKGVEILLGGGKQAVWSWLAESWLPDVLERTRETVGKNQDT